MILGPFYLTIQSIDYHSYNDFKRIHALRSKYIYTKYVTKPFSSFIEKGFVYLSSITQSKRVMNKCLFHTLLYKLLHIETN